MTVSAGDDGGTALNVPAGSPTTVWDTQETSNYSPRREEENCMRGVESSVEFHTTSPDSNFGTGRCGHVCGRDFDASESSSAPPGRLLETSNRSDGVVVSIAGTSYGFSVPS